MRAPIALMFALTMACQAPTAIEAPARASAVPDAIAPYAGRWIHRGPYNIIAQGTDTIWAIERGAAGWTIQLTLVHHPSVNVRPRIITRQEFAAVPLAWIEGCFAFRDFLNPKIEQRITVEMRSDQLFFPALVQRDERTWEFRSWIEHGVFQCSDDPLRVPAGAATHTTAHWPGKSTYRTKAVDSIYARGERVTAIEFRQITPQGVDELCAELILERDPNSPYIRTPYHSIQFDGEGFERLPDEKWQSIRELPAHEAVTKR